jgi:uridylate kinase
MPQKKPAYKRILLKLSGESLLGPNNYGIDLDTAKSIARELKEIHDSGVEIAIMIGGGNIFRGTFGADAGMDRASADYMGLLATIMNGIALQDALEKEGMFTRHISAIEIKAVAEPFVRRRVVRHLGLSFSALESEVPFSPQIRQRH